MLNSLFLINLHNLHLSSTLYTNNDKLTINAYDDHYSLSITH